MIFSADDINRLHISVTRPYYVMLFATIYYALKKIRNKNGVTKTLEVTRYDWLVKCAGTDKVVDKSVFGVVPVRWSLILTGSDATGVIE